MRKLQQGFGVIWIILMVVVLAAIGGTGWYVMTQRNKKPAATTDQSKQTPSPSPTTSDVNPTAKADETDSWYLLELKDYKVRVPDGWTLENQTDADSMVYSKCTSGPDCLTYRKGEKATIELVTGGRDGGFKFFMYSSDTDYTTTFKADQTELGSLAAKNVTGKIYFREQTSEAEEAAGPAKGDKVYTYWFVKGSKKIMATYNRSVGDPDNKALVEQALKTLEIL